MPMFSRLGKHHLNISVFGFMPCGQTDYDYGTQNTINEKG